MYFRGFLAHLLQRVISDKAQNVNMVWSLWNCKTLQIVNWPLLFCSFNVILCYILNIRQMMRETIHPTPQCIISMMKIDAKTVVPLIMFWKINLKIKSWYDTFQVLYNSVAHFSLPLLLKSVTHNSTDNGANATAYKGREWLVTGCQLCQSLPWHCSPEPSPLLSPLQSRLDHTHLHKQF